MNYDEELAIDIAERINAIIREVPPETQPFTVMTGLLSPLARLIRGLREEDREPAADYMCRMLRECGDLPRAN